MYYARMKTKWGKFYKLGYTSQDSLEERLNYGEKNDGGLVDRVLLWAWSDSALHDEQRLHGLFHNKRVFGKYGKFHNGPLYKNGQSELYAEDIFDLDPECTKEQVKNSIKAAERIGIEYRNDPIGDHPIWRVVGYVLMVALSPLILLRKILEETVPAMKREKERILELERKRETDIAAAVLEIKRKSTTYRDGAGSNGSCRIFDRAKSENAWKKSLCDWLNRALTVEPEDMTAEDMFRVVKGNFSPATIDSVECLVLGDAQGGRHISALPECLYELRGLRSLHLQRNEIEHLGDKLGQLVNLEELKLGGTALKTLPAAIGQLKKLRILTAWWSDLESLPPEIGQLSELEGLDVSGCENLKVLPSEIVQLRKIKRLYLPAHDDFKLTAEQQRWADELKKSGAEVEHYW
ncbi:leucine-rich repeat domain-containing protein [Modicisalibacter sp. 'Wilcox']|uniref:leucine-rich repeat domain-containing protein n=1 Tax=Modicisalibacter sp. 'Wilcox' TaxID=2679914 RepID=UPI0013D56A1E|nr:leucine-rich repeat domain-containing protein [Modicisalibacter sp. 'Wilcox']